MEEAWNRRPGEDALRARAEAAEAALAAALKAVEDRAAEREAQVEVAREAGGEWQAVALKAGELRAMAEALRRLLAATNT